MQGHRVGRKVRLGMIKLAMKPLDAEQAPRNEEWICRLTFPTAFSDHTLNWFAGFLSTAHCSNTVVPVT